MSFKKKIQRIFIAALAVMALCASSISACTCSHHQEQVKAEEPSCHSHSHHKDASAEQGAAFSKSLESACECILAKPAPAVISRSDKESKPPRPDAAPSELHNPSFERNAIISTVSAKIERAETAFPSKILTSLLPSRAPPRL